MTVSAIAPPSIDPFIRKCTVMYLPRLFALLTVGLMSVGTAAAKTDDYPARKLPVVHIIGPQGLTGKTVLFPLDFDDGFRSGSPDEYIAIRGIRHPAAGPIDHLPVRTFYDGHAEGDVAIGKIIRFKVRLGQDRDHDPVTGTFLRPFGEAYAASSPLLSR